MGSVIVHKHNNCTASHEQLCGRMPERSLFSLERDCWFNCDSQPVFLTQCDTCLDCDAAAMYYHVRCVAANYLTNS